MARAPLENRSHIVDTTLTLRLTRQDRELLQELVAMKAAELVDTGMEATAASYVRGLIRHEARVKGLVSPSPQKKRSTQREGAIGEHARSSARKAS